MTKFGAAASSSSSSSSSFTFGWPYHVFLSFRGEDTRYGFTGHLYNALHKRGIRTFIDDDGIRKGEDITPTLLKKIEESKTAIVVFSKDYASSTFCLTELVQILDCMKGHNGRFIWPVFYDVNPSDIRHQKRSYKKAFDRYERVKDETTVKRWRLALTEAANMSGWHVESKLRCKSYEYEIIEKIIGVVSKEISIGPLHVAQFSVGLESRVKEVCSLLNKEPHFDGATMVGICGIGGIGKTTIARAVYNEIASRFEYRCFLPNIKEKSIQDHQKTLLSVTIGEKDIELNYDKSGIPLIKDRLHNKKVLLILDDIDTLEQLRAIAGESNWFGVGSRIIITTRDRRLLKKHEVERIYEVKELIYEEARELLILNAFKNKEADPEYEKVMQRAVQYASGLPLVLEILGSNFHICQTIEEWETALDIYEKIPDKSVQKILKVSYDGLEETQKEIFLDIACFCRGESLEDASKILSASRGVGLEFCIGVLIDKSLIKIDEDGCLDMHDLIQDMGQEIVRQESPMDAGRRSRLWSYEDILHVLEENTGTGKIQVMRLLFDDEMMEWSGEAFVEQMVEWSGEAFENMKNLRVLSIYDEENFWSPEFSQGPKCLPNSLRVLKWREYPSWTLPDDFRPNNLVTLDLTRSCLKTLGKPFKYCYNLRQLDLSYSRNLEEIPDITGAANLEELNVSGCSNLTKIDDSVGQLTKLRVLKAKRCCKLDTFIVGGIKLVSLEILNLKCCYELHTFPEILVTMEKIRTLDLSYTAIETLPESIEKLVALERLCTNSYRDFRKHDLKTLYLDGYDNLQEIRKFPPYIEVFSAEYCKFLTSGSIRALSKQYCYNLRRLDLINSDNLEEIPDISGAANLEELNVSDCSNLTKIDDSVGQLTKLRVLKAKRCCKLDTFIVGGINLVSLEILNLKRCYELHTFPEILVTMEKIKTLDLSHTAIKTLPESIEKLVALEALYMTGCRELLLLPNLACCDLKRLDLDGCKQLQEIKGIPTKLEVFSARNCTFLTSCTKRLLLTQELHENGNTQFILPGKEIPKWFHKYSTEGSLSFWVRKKFPQIALCAILKNGPLISSSSVILINGTLKFGVRDVFSPQIEIGTDHIVLFDLRKQGMNFKIGRNLLEEELNHVVVSWDGIGIGLSYQFVECIGVYVYNYDSCMEDILFENPSPHPVEVVHQICDSDLGSLSVYYDDRRDFRDKIEEDLQQQQHLTSIHQQIPKSSENVKKAKGKDIMVYGGNSNEKQDSNTLESQLQELVHRPTQEEELHLANDEDKGYEARPPSKRASDQIPVEHLQEQKKKIREEVIVELREEMRLREERMRVEFEERLQSQMASLLTSLQQEQISTVFQDNTTGNVAASFANVTSNATSSFLKEPPT